MTNNPNDNIEQLLNSHAAQMTSHTSNETVGISVADLINERKEGRHDTAIAGFEVLIRSNPDNASLWHELGCTYYWKGHSLSSSQKQEKIELGKKALEAYDHTLNIDTNFIWSLHDKGNVHWRLLLNPTEAEKIYRQCIKKEPEKSPWFYHDLGALLFHNNRFMEGISELQHAVNMVDSDGSTGYTFMWGHHDLACCYAHLGDVKNKNHLNLHIKKPPRKWSNNTNLETELKKSVLIKMNYYFEFNESTEINGGVIIIN